MKVLFVGAHPPLPLDNGGRLRTFHLLDELSQRFEVGLVCLDREPGDGEACPAEAIELALPRLARVHTVPAPPARKRGRQLASLLTRRSYTMAMHSSSRLLDAVRAAGASFEPDLVHCDSLFCAYVHPRRADPATWVLALHNHESLLKRRLAATADEWLRRTLYLREAEALAEAERSHLSHFEHAVAVSESEREAFAAFSPSTAVVPNGVEPLAEPGPPARLEPGEPLRLLFVGSLNYEPNRQGLEWFAHEVAPPARRRLRLELEAVGPGRRGPELSGVSYLGRVGDLAPLYARAHAAVVPLQAGAGSRLKVLEALGRGIPLVSTRLGVEGFDLVDGEHALIADEPAALVERLALLDASLRGNGHLAESLVRRGYRFAQEHFWPRIGERLAATYAEWSGERTSASTAAHRP